MSAPAAITCHTKQSGQAAAPWFTRIASQVRWDVITVLRNGEQLLLSFVLPILALAALSLLEVGRQPAPEGTAASAAALPAVLTMAVLSAAFTGQAITTGFDRRYGVLRLLGTTPLGRSGLVVARIMAVTVVETFQFAVIGLLAAAWGWGPRLGPVLLAFLGILLASCAFVSLGLLLAGTLRAEGVLALANLLWVVLVLGGGVLVPASRLPGVLGLLAPYLPSGALAQWLRGCFVTNELAVAPLAVLAGWAVLGTLGCMRWFRWQ